MKLYILIHEQDTDSAWGSSAKPFIDRVAAQDAMRHDYEDTIKTWGFDETSQTEEHKAYCHDGEALVRARRRSTKRTAMTARPWCAMIPTLRPGALRSTISR